MRNIEQGIIISKIIRYLEIKSGLPEFSTNYGAFHIKNSPSQLSQFRKKKIEEGLCYSFALTHAYMAALGEQALQWWEALLEAVSEWDGKESSLKNNIQLPDLASNSRKQNGTLYSLMNRVANYILYNSGTTHQSGVEQIKQHNFLKVNGPFVSEKGSIAQYAVAVGVMNNDALSELLTSALSYRNSIFLISSPQHGCSIRQANERWFFYDPNDSDGEKEFASLTSLTEKIYFTLGNLLVIQLATWDPTIKFSEFERCYDKLLTENTSYFLEDASLLLIIRYAPEKLSELIELAYTDENIRNALAIALQPPHDNNKHTALYSIVLLKPEALSRLIELARDHQNIRDALACSLTREGDKDHIPLLHLIILRKQGQLSELIKLARIDEGFRYALALALLQLDDDKHTALYSIVLLKPEELLELIELAYDYKNIQDALVIAITRENAVGLQIISVAIPPEQFSVLMALKTPYETDKDIVAQYRHKSYGPDLFKSATAANSLILDSAVKPMARGNFS